MGRLRRICKMHGGMKVSDGKTTVNYVWDYAADKPVTDKEMPLGSERWKTSERAKYAAGPRHDEGGG